MNRVTRPAEGLFNVCKPVGPTSFQVVALVRRWSGQRRVGHGGTLDPNASGVLPIALGQATRVLEYFAESPKVYRAQIELGTATDTYDAQGTPLHHGDASTVDREQVEKALESFRGAIWQLPPPYSAIKHRGTPLYRWARAGVDVPLEPRAVHIYRLDLVAWQHPLLTVEVECSKGTYIRSLAQDLGRLLGCGAYLQGLQRTRNGPFALDDAVSLPELEEAIKLGYWPSLVYPLDIVLLRWRAAILGEEAATAVGKGRPVALRTSHHAAQGPCRAYSLQGHLLALLRPQPQEGVWQPFKVFSGGEELSAPLKGTG